MTADNAKWKVRIMMHFLQKELTKVAKEQGILIPKDKSIMDVIHDDLRVCPNRGIRLIYKNIVEAGVAMKERYQTSTIIDLVPFALWVAYHDTAYRDPMFYVLNNIINDSQFKDDIKPFVKEPKDWYCPIWHDAKENTNKLRANGEISEYELAPDELEFVPERQMMIKDEKMRMQAELSKQMRLHDRNPD